MAVAWGRTALCVFHVLATTAQTSSSSFRTATEATWTASTWAPQEEFEAQHPVRPTRISGQHAEKEWLALVRAELNRSLSVFARADTRKEAEDVLAILLHNEKGITEKRIIVYGNRVFAHPLYARLGKNRMHAGMLLSVAEKYGLPNLVVAHSQGAFGEAIRYKKRLVPTTVIAKKKYATPGVLVPNPFFAHGNLFTEYVRVYGDLEQGRRRYPWAERDRRAFWRGEILGEAHLKGEPDDEPAVLSGAKHCKRHMGNFERLVAASLTVKRPDEFDVRCNHNCRPKSEATMDCPGMAYDEDMRVAASNVSLITDRHWVEMVEYAKYQYLVNLPGKTSGSYSRNLNHLWLMGSVVVQWDTPTVEWYYPALRNGVTHVAINKTNAVDVVETVRSDPALERRLAENAVRVGHEFVCPRCLAKFLREALLAYRDRFSQGLVLDDPATATAFLETHFDCDDASNQHVEFVFSDDPTLIGEHRILDVPVKCDDIYRAATSFSTVVSRVASFKSLRRLHRRVQRTIAATAAASSRSVSVSSPSSPSSSSGDDQQLGPPPSDVAQQRRTKQQRRRPKTF